MHYCTYHQTEHDISEFGTTKYGKPKSWCRAAFAESNRLRTTRKAQQREQEKKQKQRKVCTGPCGMELPLSVFEERPDRPGKLKAYCPTCDKVWRQNRNKESYARFRDKRIQEKRKWRAENPEVSRAQVKAYREKLKRTNPEKYKAYQAQQNRGISNWKKNHPDQVKEIYRRYVENNRPKIREKNRRRAALRRGATGLATFKQVQARIDFYGGLCYLCGNLADTIDHVIPLVKGGTEWPSNLRPACRSCNSSKGAK